MIKLRYPKKLFRRSSSKGSSTTSSSSSSDGDAAGSARGGEIEWEVRPGGMLVQKRDDGRGHVDVITVRVATGFSWHDVSVVATCTFGQYSLLICSPTLSRTYLLYKGMEINLFRSTSLKRPYA
jgi:hypothetical protein